MSEWVDYIIEINNKKNKLTKKQENILIAAIELISENGYDKVSTAQIAQKAGVAEGTIFRQYKTKKDLLNAIVIPSFVRLLLPTMVEELIDNIIDQDYISFEELIRNLVEDRIKFARKNTPLLKIVVQEIISQEYIREEITSLFYKISYEKLIKVIDNYKEKGEIVDYLPITVFRIITTNILGYIIPRFVLFDSLDYDDEKEKEIVVKTIVKSLSKN